MRLYLFKLFKFCNLRKQCIYSKMKHRFHCRRSIDIDSSPNMFSDSPYLCSIVAACGYQYVDLI